MAGDVTCHVFVGYCPEFNCPQALPHQGKP